MIYLVQKANTPGTYVQWVHYGNDWTNKGEISLGITTDDTLDSTSSNPIQNAAIAAQIGYFVCGNGYANSEIKDVDALGFNLPDVGGDFKIKMNAANTHAGPVYLRFNSSNDTKAELKYNRESVSPTNTWEEGEVLSVYYDGTYYQASNAMGGGSAVGKKVINPTATNRAITTNGNTIGAVITNNVTNWCYAKYAVNEGDVVMISGTGGSSPRLWAIADVQENILSKEETINATREDLVLVMPAGAKWIVLNNNGNTYSNYKWYYAKAGTIGIFEILTSYYLNNDVIQLITGNVYKENDPVISSIGQLLRVTQDIKYLDTKETITAGDLRVYSSNTYQAQESVSIYSGDDTDYSDGDYAIGNYAEYTLTITAGTTEGNITVNETTIAITEGESDIDIAAAIASGVTIEDWTLTANGDGTITVKCNIIGANTTTITFVDTDTTGVTINGNDVLSVTGSDEVRIYDGSAWNNINIIEYAASSIWTSVTENWLAENAAKQNSVSQDIWSLEENLAYIYHNIINRTEKLEDTSMKEDEELVIAKALTLGTSGDAAGSSFSGIVTINNSDNILIFGMSFGVGYAMSGKHWTDIVSMFSDYTYCNKSLGGTSAIDMMNKLLYGSITPRPNSRYALILCSGNTNVNQDYLLQEVDNMCKVCLSLGITPIVGTNHRNYLANTQECMYMANLYRNYCNQNHYLFIDSAEYWRLLKNARYDFQSHGSHLDNWSMPVEAYPYMYYLDGLERPVKSIKLFTPRETVTNLNDLVFNNNIMRAKRFREYYMNNYTDSSLTFSKGYALISAIVPCVQTNTSLISLELDSSSPITVYVRNTRRENYPKKTGKQTRFLISSDVSVWPSVGNTYTFNGTTFTINHISKGTVGEEGYEHHEGAYADFYCTPDLDNGGSPTSGELTIATGSGDALISFAGYETGTTWSSDKTLVDAYIGGKWVVLSPDINGKYTMTNLYGIMDVDKVDFLVKSNNEESFSIASGSIKVSWKASEMKNNYFRTPVEEFHSNYTRTTDELIAEPTFGAAGTTQSTWKDGNGNYLVSEANYEKAVLNKNGFYPMDATSVIKVSNTVSMNYTIPANSLREFGDIVIEIVARFWNGYTENLTTDSWDFNELYVGFGGFTYNGRTYSKFSDQVGLYWKICQFRVTITHDTALSNDYQPLPLKIYAEKAGMEIARVSVKYVSKL